MTFCLMTGIMLCRVIVTYDLSLSGNLYTIIWKEWVDTTVKNEVRKVALWISNRIVYTSCGLLKKFLLYILMLHLSGQYLCIMARPSLLHVSQIVTDFLLRARQGFEGGECESHGFWMCSMGEKRHTRCVRERCSAVGEKRKKPMWGQ